MGFCGQGILWVIDIGNDRPSRSYVQLSVPDMGVLDDMVGVGLGGVDMVVWEGG